MTQRRTQPPAGRPRASASGRTGGAGRPAARPATGSGARTPAQAKASGERKASARGATARPAAARAGVPRTPPRTGARPASGTRRTAPAARRPAQPARRDRSGGGGGGRRRAVTTGGMPPGNPRRRMRFLTVATLFVLSVFGAQLVRIQGFDATAVAEEAQLKREAAQIIPAMRGQILASDGTVLASSVVREVVVADQQAVCTYGTRKPACDPETSATSIQQAATRLAPLLDTTVSELVAALTGTSRYRVLSRDVTPLTWNKISDLGIPGIYRDRRETRSERTYPQGTTAAALVGYVTGDGKPGGGVELMADERLQGTPGRQTFEQGRDGTIIPTAARSTTPAVDGNDVRLTINSSLQWYAQNSLAQRIKETKAQSGTVVIMSAKTGDLLSVASYPTFDPDTDVGKKGAKLGNYAFSDVFEPGSTSKVMTIAAALEEKTVTPSTPVVIPNRLPRWDYSFKDSHEHATLYRTVAGTLAESSNIGTILVSETLKPKTLETYFRRFGLGSLSGTGFPGESRGLLARSEDWSGSQRATVAFGQGVSVTAIQAASVFQTIANDGVRVSPRLVDSVTEADGTVTPMPPATQTRVVSPGTAKDVSRMLEGVVSPEGTAEEAQIPGYRVAGKTGTADYYDSRVGGYSGRTASFIGYAPADDPEIVVAVIVQKPTYPFFGGYVAGPVFKDVTTYALQELKIPPTGAKATPVTLKVDPAEALADPTLLRNGKKPTPR
ncbi:penicillin-binding transpeptidase domain-containing protein [Oryzobacter sp. R7]|uniref:peptidoglycan D,D-transpeptidase FtsI family protein n=1 Tax=Oryzobacter faecalis TaxID=3388656 RepID=UPI00398D6457